MKTEGVRFVYSTGEKINPTEWNFDYREPINLTGRDHGATKRRSIKAQLNRYTTLFNELTQQYKIVGEDLTIEIVRQEFNKEFKRNTSSSNGFIEVFEGFISQKKNNWTQSTFQNYRNVKDTLKDFEAKKNYKLTFSRITQDFYAKFTDFCMTDKGHINNTYARNIGFLKTFLSWAFRNNYTYNDKFKDFKKKTASPTAQIALEKKDLEI